jgi:hypothetical protein
VKHWFIITVLSLISSVSFGQVSHDIVFPDSIGWNVISENQDVSFWVKSSTDSRPRYGMEGMDNLGIYFDTLGNFHWKPSFDLVDRVQKSKQFTVIFQATWRDGKRVTKPVTFTVNHVNRPPVVEELPMFYVKQSTQNTYQFSSDYVYDPDGDPLVFKPIQEKMPEGANLTSQGLLTWSTSRSQFNQLRKEPVTLEFVVQDQPDKAEKVGKLRIAQTQQDLPPEILIVPGDTTFTIKEDETLNLKIYISDPNGDDNVKNASFISNDKRLQTTSLKENTPLQYEFTWEPGYSFVQEVQKQLEVDVTFFAFDKTNNRVERKIKIKVTDAENMIEKDAHQYKKYRDNLADATILLADLDEHQKKLNTDYKKAKKGKKNRTIVNATFGAVSGFSPIIFQDDPDQAKIVGGVGGTTILTLGTLEAAEVIGKSRQDIMDRLKTGIEIRNRIQSAGDEFSRRFALKSSRRNPEFEKEIEKLRNAMNDQRIVLLEMDAEEKGSRRSKVSNKDIKKTFIDFSEEEQ